MIVNIANFVDNEKCSHLFMYVESTKVVNETTCQQPLYGASVDDWHNAHESKTFGVFYKVLLKFVDESMLTKLKFVKAIAFNVMCQLI